MSSFLVNLARRGAGLPVTTIQAPPLSPLRPEIRDTFTEADESAPIFRKAEGLATGNTASPPSFSTSSIEGYRERSQAPTHQASSVPSLSRAEAGPSIQPIVGESVVTPDTPPREAVPVPRERVSLGKREADGISLPSPRLSASDDRPFHADRAVIDEIDVGQSRYSIAHMIHETKSVGEPPRYASGVAIGSPLLIQELKAKQILAPMERPTQQTEDGTQKRREPVLSAPTIHPVLGESHRFLQFPKATPASSTASSAQLPIHVRIGRVEVRAATAPTQTPARPNPPAQLGFERYYRVRNYRR